MAEGYNKESSYTFEYDTEQLVQAKTLALYNANLCSTANGILSSASNPESGIITTVTSDYNSMKLHIGSSNCYEGEPYSELTPVDFSLLEDAKSLMATVTQSISEFNDEMDRMIGIIVKYVDPDLAEQLKTAIEKIEKQAIKDYLDLGAAGAAIDVVQLYKLLAKYDSSKLNLTEDQKTFFEYVCKEAKAKIEYDNMSGLEKFGQGCIVFGASVVDGVLYVGEELVDGVVFLSGEAVGLCALGLSGPEARQKIIDGTLSFVDIDISGAAYDAYVEAAGLNSYIAYGSVHKVGLAVGKAAGENMLTLIPGGKAAQVAVACVRAVGQSVESTAGENREYRELSAAWAGAKALISEGIDLIPEDKVKSKNAAEIIQGLTDETGDKLIEYYTKGETDDPSIKGFIEKYGADCVMAAADVAIDKGSKYAAERFIEGKKPSTPKKDDSGSSDSASPGTETPKKEAEKSNTEEFKENLPKDTAKAAASSTYEEVTGTLSGEDDQDGTADEVRNVDYAA